MGGSYIELVLVKGLRSLAHGVPEARSGQRGLDCFGLVSVLLGLSEIADGAAKVLLLHAQKSHTRGHAAIVRFLLEQIGKALLRLVEPVRVEGRKGRALGGRARNAGVHLRQLQFVLFQTAGELDDPADAP